jgi:small-conductance mechanosensitive channel
MTDNTQLTPSDDKQLPASDDIALPSGDDLAAQALGQPSSTTGSTDDETEASDQIAETVTSLQGVIERNADQLDELKAKTKLLREQLKSIFDNDTELAEATQMSEQVTTQVKERKSKLKADPQVTRLQVELTEVAQQKKEIEEALSDHLVNFFQLTSSKSFDTSDGDQREFVIKASVKSKRV